MQEKVQLKSKKVILKFNQITVNRKYLKKDENGQSLWDKTKEKYVQSFAKKPEFNGIYKYLPNEDAVIRSMLIAEYKEPYIFERTLKSDKTTYTIDEINAMSAKEKAGLHLYEMNEEDAAFYLDNANTKVLARDDGVRRYRDKNDFDRDVIKVPLAEIVG
jgi:hypothetical protein